MKPIRLFCYMFLLAFFGPDSAQRSIAFSHHFELNPLSPNINIQILQTDPHTFPLRIS